jgi:hypothetical protein
LIYPPGIDEKRWGCYYLRSDHNRYRFSMNLNLNKLLTDRRSGVSTRDIDERVKQVVQEAFKTRPAGLEWVPFPDKSGQVSDRPALTLVAMSPTQGDGDPATLKLIDQIVRENGQSGRTFKSALLFAVAEHDNALRRERKRRKCLKRRISYGISGYGAITGYSSCKPYISKHLRISDIGWRKTTRNQVVYGYAFSKRIHMKNP